MGTPPETTHVAALASAVADPVERAWYLTADDQGRKKATTRVAVNEAAQSGLPFMVQPATDILSLDADTPDLAARTRRVADNLTSNGYPSVLVSSGRECGLHLFALIPDAAVYETYRKLSRDQGIDVRSWIRPPLSPHPSGYPVGLVTPTDPAHALAVLTRPNGQSPPLRTRSPFPLLSDMMMGYLKFGDNNNRYQSRSEMIQALATSAVQHGWTFDYFQTCLEDHSNQGGEGYRDRGAPKARERWLRMSWAKAVRFAEERPPISNRADAVIEAGIIRAAATAVPWKGKAGGTDRLVLLAHLDKAEEWGRTAGYVLSTRDCSSLAGVSANTVTASQRRLIAAGWLYERWNGRHVAGSRWEVRIPYGIERPTEPAKKLIVSGANDAFQPGALSRHTPAIIELLEHQPRTIGDLAETMGLSATTIQRALQKARENGIVARDNTRVWHVLRDDPDVLTRVACREGTDGIVSARKDRHAIERAAQQSFFDMLPPVGTTTEPDFVTPPGDTGLVGDHAFLADSP